VSAAEAPAPEPAPVAEPIKPGKVAPALAPAAETTPEAAEVPPNPIETPVSVEAASAGKSTWGTASGGKATVKKAKQLAAKQQPAAAPDAVVEAPEELPWANAPVAAAKQTVAIAQDTPVDSVLGSLFGGVAAPQPPAAPVEQVASAEPVVAAKPAPKANPKAAKGSVFLQVASLRSPKEADDFAARLGAEQSKILDGVETRVKPVVLGNMGTFYAVHVGPFASATAGEGLCTKLRANGVDCFVATP
jgi:hypothetical protein